MNVSFVVFDVFGRFTDSHVIFGTIRNWGKDCPRTRTAIQKTRRPTTPWCMGPTVELVAGHMFVLIYIYR